MSTLNKLTDTPADLILGFRRNERVPEGDQKRQRAEVEELLRRLRTQPGVILADEVGMGKTFVALGVAYSVAVNKKSGPVVVMVPNNLIEKWVQDFKTFCDLYLEKREAVCCENAESRVLRKPSAVRYGVARHSVELMRLLDDHPRERAHLIFLAQGAMSRNQSDKWVRLLLISEALRWHARGKNRRLIQVSSQIHRFLAELLWAIGEERAQDWGDNLWLKLLKSHPQSWKEIYNEGVRTPSRQLRDDPVPKSVVRALGGIDLKPIARALENMPTRRSERLSERISQARGALLRAEKLLWNQVLIKTRWRSPLLILDEAHHLKNSGTALARVFQTTDTARDLRTGDGAMANAFERMLFLTATPFQLGHYELVSVLRSFRGTRWNVDELGTREDFDQRLEQLFKYLTESQRTAIALQRCWSRLRPEDFHGIEDAEVWWHNIVVSPTESLNTHQRAVRDAFETARRYREWAEKALRPWIIRHNKTQQWTGTTIARRERLEGARISGITKSDGLPIPSNQLLPFFLAARSAAQPSKDILGEALCSSYEAFRFTRRNQHEAKDELDDTGKETTDLSHSHWYLGEFDSALEQMSGAVHPKISATVQRVVDLWEAGEKVLVFAFYRHTCRALRIHISDEIERRIDARAQAIMGNSGQASTRVDVDRLLERIRDRFFDKEDARGRKALDRELSKIIQVHSTLLDAAAMSEEQRQSLVEAMRRFLRVSTTLIRCFPIAEVDQLKPGEAVTRLLDYVDGAAGSWRKRFDAFIKFLTVQCSDSERGPYLEAALRTETGKIGVLDDEDARSDAHKDRLTLANVQVATGTTKRETRARLMRAFNTPFFPDIFVCSEVMGEGVDLQRFCRHVIHHDLAWNPSSIEQRTGRIDRLGCKAEGRESILIYLPYLAGTADERQYRVMSDRERWFRVVMGQDAVAKLITQDKENAFSLPEALSETLTFKLHLEV